MNRMNMIKAVIFDMDGVIVDSEPIQSKSLEILLREYGKKPKYHNNGLIHTVGIAGDDAYKEFIKEYDLEEDIEILRKKRRKIFVDLIKKELKPIYDLKPLIKNLKQNGFKIALASNRFIEHVMLMVKKLGLESSFDVIVGHSPDIHTKPHPDIYLITAKRLKIPAKYCLAIEDTEYGVLSAIAAGMKVIAIPNRYTKDQDFSQADIIVKNLSNISLSLINDVMSSEAKHPKQEKR